MGEETEYNEVADALSPQYDIEGRLGKGFYGSVFKAKCKTERKSYAIKILPANKDREKYQKRELEALIRLNRLIESKRHFIKYFKSWLQQVGDLQKVCIQMELCSGDLRTFVNKNKLSDPQTTQTTQGPRFYQHVFQQILNGLDVIHSIGWIHRDIHPGNILVVNSNPQQIIDIQIKIGDFGLAKNIGIEFKISPGLSLNAQLEQSTPGLDGLYTAPEFLTTTYDEKVDLYSAGIVLYFISRYPKSDNEYFTELKNLKEGKLAIHERLFYKDDKNLIRLITDLLKAKPDERPSAYDAKKYMFPEPQDTTDAKEEPAKIVFYAKKENEDDLRLCYLNKMTLAALKAEIERRTGVKIQNQDLRQVSIVNNRQQGIIIQDNEDIQHIFTEAAQEKRKVVLVVKEIPVAEDDDIVTGQISSEDEVMISA